MTVSTTAAFASGQTISVQDAIAGSALTTIATNTSTGATAAGQASSLAQNTNTATALGSPADVAWSGSGSGSVVAILKRQSSATAPAPAGTATVSSKPAATAATTLLAANGTRKRYVLFNDSTAIAYVLEGAGTAGTANYTFQLAPGQPYATTDWAGSVSAVWSAANGAMRVTEQTA